jgi:hypothetical protein
MIKLFFLRKTMAHKSITRLLIYQLCWHLSSQQSIAPIKSLIKTNVRWKNIVYPLKIQSCFYRNTRVDTGHNMMKIKMSIIPLSHCNHSITSTLKIVQKRGQGTKFCTFSKRLRQSWLSSNSTLAQSMPSCIYSWKQSTNIKNVWLFQGRYLLYLLYSFF